MQDYIQDTLMKRLSELIFFNLMDMSNKMMEQHALEQADIITHYNKRARVST
jgi:hypothetical protein